MDPQYASRYRELYEHHWWWRARERLLLEELRRLCPTKGFGSILDVGCGDGLFFDGLSAFGEVGGVEPDRSLIDPHGQYRDRIHVGPFDDSFDPGKRYGLVLMLDVLEHLPEPEQAIRHALDLLGPAGVFLATVPAFNALWTSHDEYNRHLTRYTKRSFERLARAAGLRIDRRRYFFHWTFAAKLAVRVVEALRSSPPGPAAVPPRLINTSLDALSRLEASTVGRLPMPFGSSLLVVGGKLTP